MSFIPVASPILGQEEARAVHDVVAAGWISMGKKVEAFEAVVKARTGARHAIAMNNGTSTLQAMLAALGIGPGDEVIVPSLTYISSANVVLYQGAELVLCESDPTTFNTTPELVRAKITPRTKAFMTVDMRGMPVDYDAFAELSRQTGVPFLSDSAEALGAVYKDRPVGSTGALAHSFSFFANKAITTGEGGMVVTDDDALCEKLRILRNQGQEGRYNHTHLGNNWRMTDIAAAIGIEQMKRIDFILREKERLARRYDERLAAVPGVKTPLRPSFVSQPSWYLYSIEVPAERRDGLVEHLRGKDIETRLSFPPVHVQPYYQKRFGYGKRDFPVALDAWSRAIDIPIWAGLSDLQQDRVISEIAAYMTY